MFPSQIGIESWFLSRQNTTAPRQADKYKTVKFSSI